jgi:signal recognition particle receptor subunit alpha|tara:strand:- start:11208 stop:12398 length:1191 start_codon:yes stop_codon:yes gene_type:complete
MLDSFQIFTKGGLVLFQWSLMGTPTGSPIDELVKNCLLQERGGAAEFTHSAGCNQYTLRWRVHNMCQLVFVAVYPSTLRLGYVDVLLDSIKDQFVEGHFDKSLVKLTYPEFEVVFTKMLKKEEAAAALRSAPKTEPKAFDKRAFAEKKNDASGKAKIVESDLDAESATKITKSDSSEAFDLSKMKASLKLKSKKGGGNGMSKSSSGNLVGKDTPESSENTKEEKTKDKKTKEKRVWAGENAKRSTEGLDFSEGKPPETTEVAKVDITKPSRVDSDDDVEFSDEEFSDGSGEDESESVAQTTSSKKATKKTFFASLLKHNLVRNVVGKTSLERDDLSPVLDVLKTSFMNKNVAEDIAEKLCESVCLSLQGAGLSHVPHTAIAHTRPAKGRLLSWLFT